MTAPATCRTCFLWAFERSCAVDQIAHMAGAQRRTVSAAIAANEAFSGKEERAIKWARSSPYAKWLGVSPTPNCSNSECANHAQKADIK